VPANSRISEARGWFHLIGIRSRVAAHSHDSVVAARSLWVCIKLPNIAIRSVWIHDSGGRIWWSRHRGIPADPKSGLLEHQASSPVDAFGHRMVNANGERLRPDRLRLLLPHPNTARRPAPRPNALRFSPVTGSKATSLASAASTAAATMPLNPSMVESTFKTPPSPVSVS